MSKIWSLPSLVAGGFGYDRAVAALFCGAKRGETVSQMAALAQLTGQRWGCVMCRLLHWLVERDHCRLALSPDAETRGAAAVRAGLTLLVGAAVPLSFLCWAGWQGVFRVLDVVR